MRYAAVALAFSALPALADCPDAPNHSARLSELITAAQIAPDEETARRLSAKMWQLWADAPDEVAQSYLDAGMSRRALYDFSGALGEFNQLVRYCPNYAEGYNQRAFVNFLRKNYDPALQDLNRAIELSPRHVAAIAGKALTLIGLGRDAEAQIVLREAVKLNPWLNERHLLTGDKPKPETDL
ncbi:MAG: hypothetical protein AAF891_04705 [Pseudomonadota bacterium]